MALVVVCSFAVVASSCSASTSQNKSTLPHSAQSTTAGSHGQRRAILIKTRINGFDGTVVDGSKLGDAAFCGGGTVHHESGSPEIGHPAINAFTCGDSRLEIGFGPGPDQMDNRIQTSDWDVLTGTGVFNGVTGSGSMQVEWTAVGTTTGEETFTGTLLVP